MNIILTRPLNDTENLMQELFSLGHKIMHVPTLKIKKANIEKINIEDYNALVFTSSNAVRNLNINGEKKNIKCFCKTNKNSITNSSYEIHCFFS